MENGYGNGAAASRAVSVYKKGMLFSRICLYHAVYCTILGLRQKKNGNPKGGCCYGKENYAAERESAPAWKQR